MISLFLDYYQTIEEMVIAAKELGLKRIPLRNIEGVNIYTFDSEKIQEISNSLKKERIRIGLLDINENYDLYDVIKVEQISAISKELKCTEIVINLPLFLDFATEKNQLITVLNQLLFDFRKQKLNVSFHINYQIDSSVLAYILKNIPKIMFCFNPGKTYENNKSITSYYRLLRNNIDPVIVYDLDKNKKPALLGYGQALILDIIDKLRIDKYRGYIYYDSNLVDYIEAKQEVKKKKRFSLFKRKKRLDHQKIDEKLHLTEGENIDFTELLKSQLKFLSQYNKTKY